MIVRVFTLIAQFEPNEEVVVTEHPEVAPTEIDTGQINNIDPVVAIGLVGVKVRVYSVEAEDTKLFWASAYLSKLAGVVVATVTEPVY